MQIIFNLFLLVLCVSAVPSGRKCSLKNSYKTGKCVNIINCEKQLQRLLHGGHTDIDFCGMDGTATLVCCEDTARSDQDSFTSTSVKPTTSTVRNINQRIDFDENTKNRKVGEISRKKCEEYSTIVNKKIFDPALNSETRLIEISYCDSTVRLVVGGKKAQAKEFPHMVLIGYEAENEIAYKCGGSIISETFILTAAHCAYGPTLAKYVLAGDLDTSTNLDDAKPQLREVRRFIRHPDYDSEKSIGDIALIELNNPLELNLYARPACLSTQPIIPQTFMITGWGRIEFNGPKSPHLLKAIVKKVGNSICNNSYDGQITDKVICAASPGTDTCLGDSGGPLQVYTSGSPAKCMFDIVGVTSYGKGCANADYPGVYSNVYSYLGWIEDYVWPL